MIDSSILWELLLSFGGLLLVLMLGLILQEPYDLKVKATSALTGRMELRNSISFSSSFKILLKDWHADFVEDCCTFLFSLELNIGGDKDEFNFNFDIDWPSDIDISARVIAHCNVSATVQPKITFSSSRADRRHAAITFVFVWDYINKWKKDRRQGKIKNRRNKKEENMEAKKRERTARNRSSQNKQKEKDGMW